MNERHPSMSAPKRRTRRARTMTCSALAASLLFGTLPVTAQDNTGAQGRNVTTRGRAAVTLNFVNAEIDAVTRAMSAMLDRPIMVDPRVRGQITVYSEQPLSVRKAYLNYLAALRGLGFTVVENAGLLKVVPEADAKLQAGTVSIGTTALRGDQIITQVFRLNYENANNLVTVLRPLISPNNTINANPGNNTLVITDYADNLQRITRIIAALDTPAGTDIDVVQLQHAVASDLAPLVQRLAEGGGGITVPGVPVAGGGGTVTVIPDPRSNSLILRASNPARLTSVRAIIEKLDRTNGTAGPGGNIYVVHLKHAEATKLAQVLRAAYQPPNLGGSGGGAAGGGGAAASPATGGQNNPASRDTGGGTGTGSGTIGGMSGAATAPVTPSGNPQTGGFVQADPASNSLIITAPEPMYRQLRALIDTLDVRRPQVYIESMIVELNGNNAVDIGLQWQGLLGHSGSKYGVFAGTNYTADPQSQANIIDLSKIGVAGSSAVPATTMLNGLNIGVLKNYGGTYALAALAQLLESQGNTNIISTPNLITLDNEEAKVVVGQNVPFVTGQFTNTGTSTTNPFQTIERKDVGITLRIKPQVGDDGTVRMTIYQESSSVSTAQAVGTAANSGPTTDQRVIDTNVIVNDGDVLVLGGLIQDTYTDNKSKVPLLGDIPYLGALFRSESRERKRTNLMVFLRPVVMRDSETQNKLSLDRYELIRAQQKDAQPPYSPLLRINETGVLPPARRIDAPSPALPGTPQTETPLAAPQTSPGTQGTPPSAEQRGRGETEPR